MKAIDRLKSEALDACKWRGHNMKRFKNSTFSRGVGKKPNERAYSECKTCGATVHCETFPAPNGIDIGGSAVAVGCTAKEQHETEGQHETQNYGSRKLQNGMVRR